MSKVLINDTTDLWGDEGSRTVLTTDHPASSYGQPILLNELTGQVWGKDDAYLGSVPAPYNTARHYVQNEVWGSTRGLEKNDIVIKFLAGSPNLKWVDHSDDELNEHLSSVFIE